ncbi:MAG: alkane 1-monooxygenase [Bauldia sp.]|nr:alkane 1-monooxygenase [Bauldia sp.]
MYFLLLPILSALFTASFILGGWWLALPLMIMWAAAIPMDELVGDNWAKLDEKHPFFLRAILYLQLPTLAIVSFMFAYYLSDWTFLGSQVNAARASTHWYQMFVALFSLGLYYGIAGINVAHELVHRTSRLAVVTGRWLLSFSFDTAFSLEHVYGHHLNVATPKDPATAPRGMPFWHFYVRILWQANRNAWRIEKRFLAKKGRSVWSLHNRVITGQLMSLVWVALFAAADGIKGVVIFVLISMWGKLYLEITNYIEHYGLVRVEGTRVEPRHSWNSSRRITNYLLFNLPRHSDHHVRPNREYWELEARTDAPQLPHGYFIMAIMSLMPGVYMRRMAPLVEMWDRDFATPGERALVAATYGGKGGPATPSSESSVSMPSMRSSNG